MHHKQEDFAALFIGKGAARRTDPRESHISAHVGALRRAKARREVLAAYAFPRNYLGMTDAEAERRSGIRNAWKRCSELLADGLIEKSSTVTGDHGTPVRVCRLTDDGEDVLDQLNGVNLP